MENAVVTPAVSTLEDADDRPSSQTRGPTCSEEEEEEEDDDDEVDAVLAGFRFCAREAIRFLTEEEHFAKNDPVIVELENHLKQHQTRLQRQTEIAPLLLPSSADNTANSTSQASLGDGAKMEEEDDLDAG